MSNIIYSYYYVVEGNKIIYYYPSWVLPSERYDFLQKIEILIIAAKRKKIHWLPSELFEMIYYKLKILHDNIKYFDSYSSYNLYYEYKLKISYLSLYRRSFINMWNLIENNKFNTFTNIDIFTCKNRNNNIDKTRKAKIKEKKKIIHTEVKHNYNKYIRLHNNNNNNNNKNNINNKHI